MSDLDNRRSNIHAEKPDCNNANRLKELLLSFDCVQHIGEPTHVAGGMLDFLITRTDQKVKDVAVDPPGIISDHGLITWKIPFKSQCPYIKQWSTRNWHTLDRTLFRRAIRDSALSTTPHSAKTDELFEVYETVLTTLADRYAPARTITIRRRHLAPWMDEVCKTERRKSRWWNDVTKSQWLLATPSPG